MDEVVLNNQSKSGEALKAVFYPSAGMNLASYCKGSIEAIDQETRALFEERYAGLGALIGPHFHRRPPALLKTVAQEEKFPHIARVKANGVQEPFSHGIARYAPWTDFEVTDTKISGTLRGTDEWEGVSLSELEGQNFTMRYQAELCPHGLDITFSVVSDFDSLVGFHYYYAVKGSASSVHCDDVKNTYRDNDGWHEIPSLWMNGDALAFDLSEAADYGFQGQKNVLGSSMTLQTEGHNVTVSYHCENEENSWQLYHPKGATFACIEPLSALNPRQPQLSVSSLNMTISIN